MTRHRRPATRGEPLRRLLLLGVVSSLLAGCLSSLDTPAPGEPGGSPLGSTGPSLRPSFVPPTPTPAPTFFVYVVASGDSLNSIAHRYGTTARSIAFWNRATHPSLDPTSPRYRPNLLKVGWTLQVVPNVVFDEEGISDESPGAPQPSVTGPSEAPSATEGDSIPPE